MNDYRNRPPVDEHADNLEAAFDSLRRAEAWSFAGLVVLVAICAIGMAVAFGLVRW
jgi:hypothetical protein